MRLCVLEKSYIPGLLFADDRALLSPHESRIKKSLDVFVEWSRELGVKINVNKSGIMHARQRRMASLLLAGVTSNELLPIILRMWHARFI